MRNSECEVSEDAGLQTAFRAFEAVVVTVGVVLHDAVYWTFEGVEGELTIPAGIGPVFYVHVAQKAQNQSLERIELGFPISIGLSLRFAW